jgi:hydrogenase expression/formation protein HypD
VKHLDEFRDPVLAQKLLERIRQTVSQPRVLMEVCGGQTHSLLRHGIAAELSGTVELIHGPGCPVCVTPAESIDFAQQLAREPGVVLASFGDMLRVPGTAGSLLGVRSAGGDVRMVYSPLDAVELAKALPDREIVFFAVGFETTAPATALAVLQAHRLGLKNFSLLVAHVRVLPAMELLMRAPECRVEAFLAAGHVCTVTGFEDYDEFARRHSTPVVVTGFEPLDLLDGILECVTLLESGGCTVVNRYARSVQRTGNASAQDCVHEVYEAVDTPWRGLGVIPCGGYQLRRRFEHFDATKRFSDVQRRTRDASLAVEKSYSVLSSDGPSGACTMDECRSDEVLSGVIKPHECSAFGTRCTPESPLGAPMVSAEGACAAYYQYHRVS